MHDLYQELIIDHGTHPRRFGPLPEHTHHERGHNPLCGDDLTLYLKIEDGVIEKVRFEGSGCAISMASASLMAERLEGLSVDEAKKLFEKVHSLLSGTPVEGLGKIEALSGVCKYPMRVKCATLSWHALMGALEQSSEATEK